MNILPTGSNIGALFLMVAAHIWRAPKKHKQLAHNPVERN